MTPAEFGHFFYGLMQKEFDLPLYDGQYRNKLYEQKKYRFRLDYRGAEIHVGFDRNRDRRWRLCVTVGTSNIIAMHDGFQRKTSWLLAPSATDLIKLRLVM